MIRMSWGSGYKIQTFPAFQALEKVDQDFVCPADLLVGWNLPLIMMGTGIGLIAPEFLPHIEKRLVIALPEASAWYAALRTERGVEFQVYLRRFYGVTSNIRTLSTPEWVASRADLIPGLTKTEIKAVLVGKRVLAAGCTL